MAVLFTVYISMLGIANASLRQLGSNQACMNNPARSIFVILYLLPFKNNAVVTDTPITYHRSN